MWVLSRVQLFTTSWTVGHEVPLSMEFCKQEYWMGLPFPTPGGLPNPGIEPTSPVAPALQTDSLPLSHQGSPKALHRLDVSHYRLTHSLVVLNLHMADTKNSSQKGSADDL